MCHFHNKILVFTKSIYSTEMDDVLQVMVDPEDVQLLTQKAHVSSWVPPAGSKVAWKVKKKDPANPVEKGPTITSAKSEKRKKRKQKKDDAPATTTTIRRRGVCQQTTGQAHTAKPTCWEEERTVIVTEEGVSVDVTFGELLKVPYVELRKMKRKRYTLYLSGQRSVRVKILDNNQRVWYNYEEGVTSCPKSPQTKRPNSEELPKVNPPEETTRKAAQKRKLAEETWQRPSSPKAACSTGPQGVRIAVTEEGVSFSMTLKEYASVPFSEIEKTKRRRYTLFLENHRSVRIKISREKKRSWYNYREGVYPIPPASATDPLNLASVMD